MTIKSLIHELEQYPQDKEIEIECPNGLMVRPRIKRFCETLADIGKPTKSYVITWED